MIRKIITIDSERCNGCGLCAAACHEGAIGMVNGKAVLLREDYCDGLGDCLPACPTGAITMTEREAPAYDEAAVAAHLAARKPAGGCAGGGCPAAAARLLPHRQQKLSRQKPVWDSGRCSCVWFRRWQGSLTERICCWQRTVLPLPGGISMPGT